MTNDVATTALAEIEGWFRDLGWQPQAFQRETWAHFLAGRSGLVQVPTGAGKTYAALMGPLAAVKADPCPGLQILYVAPLRAMSRDLQQALQRPIDGLGWPITVGVRTGDTSAYQRRKQRKQLPAVLLTTPESLALLLSYPDSERLFKNLRCVILDEWHELHRSKRGSLVQLNLTRLRRLSPTLRTWALSATIGNPLDAATAAVGSGEKPLVVTAPLSRPIHLETLLPEDVDAMPWGGHLGLGCIQQLIAVLDPAVSTLIFTNTRSQAERWYQALRFLRPAWEGVLALHHGSVEQKQRVVIETGLKQGTLRLVVCTASLDLGVDFGPVARIVQIGSAKGVARLLQRAGRSGHRPGEAARILMVPTHGLQLLEIAALRLALAVGEIEANPGFDKPLDVLGQHMVTCAAGGGFSADELFDEVRQAHAYHQLSRPEFDAVLAVVEHGGDSLSAYPQYHKIKPDDAGIYRVASKRLQRLHRFNIGTITANATVKLAYQFGGVLGYIEESFVARLRRGDVFIFAGKKLAFQKLHGMTAYVKRATRKTTRTLHWLGGQLPISECLAQHLRTVLHQGASGPEAPVLQPLLNIQQRLSHVPRQDQLLLECLDTRSGRHLFIYPFEGRLVHEGIAALLALRLSRCQASSFSFSVNDYGLELLAPAEYPFEKFFEPGLFNPDNLATDIAESLNLSELTRRRFRDVAQVSGLVFQGYPGQHKTQRQLQSSSTLLFDVFRQYDPGHPLLAQAEREVRAVQLEEARMGRALMRLSQLQPLWSTLKKPTPFSLPLMVERLSARLSNESLLARVTRMKRAWRV